MRTSTFITLTALLGACDMAETDTHNAWLDAQEVAHAEALEAEAAVEAVFYDGDVDRFLQVAADGETITYTITLPDEDGHEMEVEMELGWEWTPQPEALVIQTIGTLNYCVEDGPVFQRSIWARSCNRGAAEDAAEFWARRRVITACEGALDPADGPAACAPGTYQNNICDNDINSQITNTVQERQACGSWPFRTSRWTITHSHEGACGFACRLNF